MKSMQLEDEMEAINRAASCIATDQPAISFWRIGEQDFRCHPWRLHPSINSGTISTCCYRHSLYSRHSYSGSAESREANQFSPVVLGNELQRIRFESSHHLRCCSLPAVADSQVLVSHLINPMRLSRIIHFISSRLFGWAFNQVKKPDRIELR